MLQSIELENFRGFASHSLPLSAVNVVVGKNNAGKSTIVEALRLVSIVTERSRNLTYKIPPAWTGLPKRLIGVSPSLTNLEINFDSIFHQYRDPPAKIVANFEAGQSVTVYLETEERVFAVVRNAHGEIVTSRGGATKADLPRVAIMPQVAPVQRIEKELNRDYVRRSASSHLSSAHFRNQLHVFDSFVQPFKYAVEETWPGVQIQSLDTSGKIPDRELYLQIRNEDFVAEISVMGHGLQMWLQTIWFLTRASDSDTVILDEPDVYMHADLQRKIVRFLTRRFKQVVITTHSVEIMSEVRPEDVVVIDRKARKSGPATSIPAVQSLINSIGSAHNLQFARLWKAKKFLYVEGDDLGLMKQFQNILVPDSEIPIDTIPNTQVGGWGGWNYVIGAAKTLKNAIGESVVPYCIFDSDYQSPESIDRRYSEAEEHGVELHIWSNKEIESYLLVPPCIARLITERAAKKTIPPEVDEIAKKIDELAHEFWEEVFDATSAEMFAANRSKGASGANKRARNSLKDREAQYGLWSLVPAKRLLSRLSEWSQEQYGVSLSPMALAYRLQPDEIHDEVKKVVLAIEYDKPLGRG